MEKQLLNLMDFDLRFEENEACEHFAPFMLTSSPRDTRAAAVDVVSKAGRVRAQAQMPPTPPCDDPPPCYPRGPSKRTPSAAVQQSRSARPRSPAHSVTSSTTYDSDPEDTSFLMSCDTSSDHEDRVRDLERATERKFTLMPVPARAYRQARSSSASVARSETTSTYVSGNASSTFLTPLPSPVKRAALETSHSASHLSSASRTSYMAHRDDPRAFSTNSSHKSSDARGFSTSATLPSISRRDASSSTGSGSFLSRMWGAATRGGQDKSEKLDLLSFAAGEVECGQRTSTFRRLAPSKSALFKAGSQPPEYNV